MNKYRLHAEYSPCSCKATPAYLLEIISSAEGTTCWHLSNTAKGARFAAKDLRKRNMLGWGGGCEGALKDRPVVLLETTDFDEIEAYMENNLKEEVYDG